MDNTVGLLSALGADCWTGREFVQPRLNPRWARVFLSSFVVDHICGHACRWTLFGRNALAMRLLRAERKPRSRSAGLPGSTGEPVTAGEVPSRIGS